MREEGEQLHVLSTAQAAQANGLFGRKGSESAKMKASKQAIHCVRCSPTVQGDQVSLEGISARCLGTACSVDSILHFVARESTLGFCLLLVVRMQTGHAWLAHGTAKGIVHVSRIPRAF